MFRLNPGVEPERYRIVCRDTSRHCERRAEELCDGEYVLIQKSMTEPELEEVETTGVSSTGPSEGLVGWRAEYVVSCGRQLPPLELKRKPSAEPAPEPSEVATEAPPPPPPPVERVCTPGATQACLGPGACSGAQACLRDGTGYDVCDCGTNPVPAPPPTSSGPPPVSPSASAPKPASSAPLPNSPSVNTPKPTP